MKRLTLVLVLLWAAPAHASWSLSAPQTPPGHALFGAAVAGSGTVVTEWRGTGHRTKIRVGHGRPVALPDQFSDTRLAATRHAVWVAWSTGSSTSVARATADGQLSDPETAGPGSLYSLIANPAGDLAVVLSRLVFGSPTPDTSNLLARPHGGHFGRPVPLPVGGETAAVALSPAGETFAGEILDQQARTLDVVTRAETVQLTPPPVPGPTGFVLAAPTPPVLAADGRGRVLAAWLSFYGTHLFTAVRDRHGVWSTPVAEPLGVAAFPLTVSVTPDGHAVIAYRYETGISYVTGSLASRRFASPQSLTLENTFTQPEARVLPDGTSVIAYVSDSGLYLARARPGRSLSSPERVVDNPEHLGGGIAGVLRDGRLVLWVGNRLVRETRR